MEVDKPKSSIPESVLRRCAGKQRPVTPHAQRLLVAARREAKTPAGKGKGKNGKGKGKGKNVGKSKPSKAPKAKAAKEAKTKEASAKTPYAVAKASFMATLLLGWFFVGTYMFQICDHHGIVCLTKIMVCQGWNRSPRFPRNSVSKGTHEFIFGVYYIDIGPAFARWKESEERKVFLESMSPAERMRRRYDWLFLNKMEPIFCFRCVIAHSDILSGSGLSYNGCSPIWGVRICQTLFAFDLRWNILACEKQFWIQSRGIYT